MEHKQKGGADVGGFVLRMNLSSDSETEIEKQPESTVQDKSSNDLMKETHIMTKDGSELDNCTLSEVKAKLRVSFAGKKGKTKWEWKDEIIIASAVRDAIKGGLYGVTSARNAISSSKRSKELWVEVNKKLEEETGRCVPSASVYKKFDNMMRKYFKQGYKQQVNQHNTEIDGIFEELFGNGREQRLDICNTLQLDARAEASAGGNVNKDKMVLPEKKSINCISDAFVEISDQVNVLKDKTISPEEKSIDCTPKLHQHDRLSGCNLSNQIEKKKNRSKLNKSLSVTETASDKVDLNKSSSVVSSPRDEGTTKKRKKNEIHSNAIFSLQNSTSSDEEGFSVKRAKWSTADEILIASAVRDGLNCISAGKDITCFKTHREFWDKLAQKLQKETGKSASTYQVIQKFRNLKSKLYAKRQHNVLNRHEEQVLNILDQGYSNGMDQNSRLLKSSDSGTKEVVSSDCDMSTIGKSVQSTPTSHNLDLSTGNELRSQSEKKKGSLMLNEKSSRRNPLPHEDENFCLESGGNADGGQLRTSVLPEKPTANGGKAAHRQELNLGGVIEGNHNADCLHAQSPMKRIRQSFKRGWEPKDEIAIASAVRDGINSGLSGVKSTRDAMSFRSHEAFWTQLNRKLNEETAKSTSAYELFQAFRSSKYRYLNSKRCLTLLNQHDEELFYILEQIFGKGKKQRPDLSGTHYSCANVKLPDEVPSSGSNGGQKKLGGHTRISTEGVEINLEETNTIDEDNQTCMDQVPICNSRAKTGAQIPDQKDEESCPVLDAMRPALPPIPPGDDSCQSSETEPTFATSVQHDTENLNGLKDAENVKGKYQKLNEQAEALDLSYAVEQENQTCEVLLPTGRPETEQPKQNEYCPNVNVHENLLETEATVSVPVKHDMKNLYGLKDTENDKGKALSDKSQSQLNKILPDVDPIIEGNHEQWNGANLSGSRILDDISFQATDYSEVIKRLERKSRKLQLLQELYKIEQLDIEDRIRQAKLKAFSGNP